MSQMKWGLAAALGFAWLANARDADACGGCFVAPTETSVVTDHRMAFSISKTQTVLWDQIRYSGDPKEFAWVLPVRAGTVVEASTEAFFDSLEQTSVPKIIGPTPSRGSGCGFGCSSASNAAYDNGPVVQVISDKVIGPYEAVTLRSTDPNALTAWLTANQYTIPPSVAPTVAAYVREGFDFIALKLRPGQGIRSMRPVRVVYPGTDTSLPLRMVAAGTGAEVAITLFVLGEGRYKPQNFPSTTINPKDLVWDTNQNKSNYAELSQKLMAQGGGRTWLTEYANTLYVQVADQYRDACALEVADAGGALLPTRGDAGAPTDAGDAASDAAEMDASAADIDAGNPGSNPGSGCDDYDLVQLRSRQIWLTRLRANLPQAALGTDLRLEAAEQVPQTSTYYVTQNGDVRGGSGCAMGEGTLGAASQFAACALGVLTLLRRRRR